MTDILREVDLINRQILMIERERKDRSIDGSSKAISLLIKLRHGLVTKFVKDTINDLGTEARPGDTVLVKNSGVEEIPDGLYTLGVPTVVLPYPPAKGELT